MSLKGLLKIGQIKRHPLDRTEIEAMLAAAARNLKDAENVTISTETRFDCAYKTVMQCALAAMMANGYRPSTNVPGHQMTMIQALPHTIGLAAPRMVVLDALRRKRNLNDYLGSNLDEESAQACMREAARLLADVTEWMKTSNLQTQNGMGGAGND